ncbi:MAG: hypothetical protein V4463_16940 [Pseudomonadota bacterium]
MFQTDDAWKARNSGAVGNTVHGLGSQKYWCMELPLNLPIFHVDIGQYADGELVWSRFQVMEIAHLEGFLAQNEFVVRVSLQTRRSDSENYKIVRIREILRSKDDSGNIGYIYIDTDGQEHFDFRWHGKAKLDSPKSSFWNDNRHN